MTVLKENATLNENQVSNYLSKYMWCWMENLIIVDSNNKPFI